MFSNLKYKIIFLGLIPTFAYAAVDFTLKNSNVTFIIYEAISIVNLIYPLLITLSFITFFWGLSKFILNSNSEKEITIGKKYMLWGIIVLFVLVTFKTIITLVSVDAGLNGNANSIPFLPNGANPQVTTSETFTVNGQPTVP